MKDTLITFKTTELAKKKGFDEPTRFIYNQWGKLMVEQANPYKNSSPSIGDIYIHACTQSLLQKWLRENYNIHIEIHFNLLLKEYFFRLISIDIGEFIATSYKTWELFEDTLEHALLASLLLIPNKDEKFN